MLLLVSVCARGVEAKVVNDQRLEAIATEYGKTLGRGADRREPRPDSVQLLKVVASAKLTTLGGGIPDPCTLTLNPGL